MTIDIESPGAKLTELAAAVAALNPPRGAQIVMNADDEAVDATGGGVTLSFDAATFDTDSFFSGASPPRLTVPAGVSYVTVHAGILVFLTAGDSWKRFSIRHFNSGAIEQGRYGIERNEGGDTVWAANISTGVLQVAAGDYFTCYYVEESDTSVTIVGTNISKTFMSIVVH